MYIEEYQFTTSVKNGTKENQYRTVTKQSWKNRRRVAGIVVNVWLNFVETAFFTRASTLGQVKL